MADSCNVGVCTGPWVVSELGPGAVPVPCAEFVEAHVYRISLVLGIWFGGARSVKQFALWCPSAMIKSPCAVRCVDVGGVVGTAWP